MQKIIKSKDFYKVFFGLTISVALQNLLTYSVNLADNVMIGRYSQDAMSAIAICNQLQFLLQMLIIGVGEGVVVLGTQYWGKGDIKPILDIISVGLRLALGISFLMFAFAFFFPATILGWITNDTAIIAEAVKYLKISSLTYMIFASTNLFVLSLRAVGVVKIGYVISFSTLCINVCLNYCLIYGNLGFPELGIRGAAIATLVSRVAELLIVLYFVKFREKTLEITLKSLIFIDISYFKDYIKIAFPLMVTQTSWGLAAVFQTAIIGNMANSASAIPANSVAVLTFQIISVVGYGAAAASAILTGRAIGQNDIKKAKAQAFTFQWIFLALGLITGGLIFFTGDFVLSFYPAFDDTTIETAKLFMRVMALTSIGTCYQMAADSGMIRAGGSTTFSMKNNTFFMWVVALPSAFIAAYVIGAPAVVVFFCLKSDQLLKCIPVFIYVNFCDWIKNVTRETVKN